MRRNEPTAGRRQLPVSLLDASTGANFAGSLAGATIKLSLNGDYVALADQTLHARANGQAGKPYIQLSQAETLTATECGSYTVDVAGARPFEGLFTIDEVENNQATIIANIAAVLTAVGVDAAAVQAAILAEEAIDEAAILAAISGGPSANATAVGNLAIEGATTLVMLMRDLKAWIAGKAAIPRADGPYTFYAEDGVTPRIAGTIEGGIRTPTTLNGAP